MRPNNRLCCILALLLVQLAIIPSGAREVEQSLTNSQKDFAGVELAATATHFRRRLEEVPVTKDESEATKEEEGGDEAAKEKESESESKSKDSDESGKESESKDSDEGGDKEESKSKDEEEEAKEGSDEESSSSDEEDEAADGDKEAAKEDEPAAEEKPATAPELDDAGKEYFESTKDAVLTDKKESSSSDEGEGGSYPSLAPPASFSDLEEYSFETISMTSCEKIDFAIAYLTSLEFDGSVVKNAKNKQEDSKFWSDIYIVEMVLLPTSLILAFFGSSLLMLASVLTAAGFGIFLIFHFVSASFGGLDCKLKLGLSAVSASVCACLATKFVRFGLFCLGAFSTGLTSYLFFDSFPAFDPGQNFFDMQGFVSDSSYLNSVMKHSDISQAAWAIILVLALFTGICIRVYEHGSVEFLTALLGGSGAGYAIHAHILVHGGSLNRSMVFVIAGLVGALGWRFQRRRRIGKLPPKGQSLPLVNANTPSNGASWNQLQKSIDTTNAQGAGGDLSGMLNNLSAVKHGGKDK
ncbi:MAG: hypothetical protein SGBAC_005510 [Bacillariaceae sp.]